MYNKLKDLITGTKGEVLRNTAYQLIGKLFSMTITIVTTYIIARVYGIEGYGEFSLMQVWPALFFIIIDFGMNALAVKDLTRDWSLAGKYFFNIILIRILISSILSIALFAVLSVDNLFPNYSSDLLFGIKLSLLLMLTQSMYATGTLLFQTKMRYDLSTLSLIGGYIFILVWVLLASYLGWSVALVNFGYVLGGLITFALVLLYIRQLDINLTYQIDFVLWKYLFIQTLPLGIMFIFSQLNFREDSFLLSMMHLPERYGLTNTESAGVYNLPYKVFEVALVVPTFAMNALFPIFVKKHGQDKQAFKDVLSKSIMVLFTFGIVSSLVGIIFAPLIISILGGNDFAASIFVLQVLLGGMFIYYLTAPLSWLILILERQRYLPYIYLVAAIINLVLNIVFIPKYSFYASAILTHLSEFIVLLMLIVFSYKAWKSYYAK